MDGVGLEAPGKARPHGRICITNRLRRVPVTQIHTVQPLPLDASRSRARTGLLLRVSLHPLNHDCDTQSGRCAASGGQTEFSGGLRDNREHA